VSKQVASLTHIAEVTTTYYVRDAMGNTLATYDKKQSDHTTVTNNDNDGLTTTTTDIAPGGGAITTTFRLHTFYLYGSSRLGELDMTAEHGYDPNYPIKSHYRGIRHYELTNHLGNVQIESACV
jgi:hypothetical protein